MPNDRIAVELTEVSKSYGYLQALKSVTLKLKTGEFSALSGHNGAGKTTLLKMIATHITPSSGTVKIFGDDAFKDGAAGEIRNRIGFVTHASFLYDELTIRENLLFYAKLFLIKGEEDFIETIGFLGLKRWYNVPVKQLSHGLRKRADIVRALIHNPDLILLDEPFSGLDTTTCDLLVSYFKGRHEEKGKTLILSSHSLEWAKRICDKRITLDKGKIIEESSFHK
ncbi:MAG: ABC transporter ATP-binding protein [Methanosarcinales archaeon]|nr:ABC transporter ATP-binding protein [Methanosarcinales archaeon]